MSHRVYDTLAVMKTDGYDYANVGRDHNRARMNGMDEWAYW